MAKDFAGKTVTSKTYTKDWVFVKNKQPKGPNDSHGAWMTKADAKRQHEEHLAAKMERNANATQRAARVNAGGATVPIFGTQAAGNRKHRKKRAEGGAGEFPTGSGPYLPTESPTGEQTGDAIPTTQSVPPGGGIPGSSGPIIGPGPVDVSSMPSWWINAAIKNPNTQGEQFANMANALLPTLSPEDQRNLATYLATNFKKQFGGYSKVNFGPAPTSITPEMRQQFLSPERAQMALSLLDRMKKASGAKNMGAGFSFLKNAVGLINQFASNGVMTRENYVGFSNAVADLVKGAGSQLSSVSNLAQLFNLPGFSAGPLVSNEANKNLFG